MDMVQEIWKHCGRQHSPVYTSESWESKGDWHSTPKTQPGHLPVAVTVTTGASEKLAGSRTALKSRASEPPGGGGGLTVLITTLLPVT